LHKLAVPGIVISEVYTEQVADRAVLGWVELLNVWHETVDLQGFRLVCGDAGGETRAVPLVGTISGCGTHVVGGPNSNPGNGMPFYDQVVDLSAGLFLDGVGLRFVALYEPGACPCEDCPISAVLHAPRPLGDGIPPGCRTGISILEAARPGASLERLTWPEDDWRHSVAPGPNQVHDELGCSPSRSSVIDLSPLKTVY